MKNSISKKEFGLRLSKLRQKKGISARFMSVSLGKNAGYISSIECGKSFPAMQTCFRICDCLGVTPVEFFSCGPQHPAELRRLVHHAELLRESQFQDITGIVEDLVRLNQLSRPRKPTGPALVLPADRK